MTGWILVCAALAGPLESLEPPMGPVARTGAPSPSPSLTPSVVPVAPPRPPSPPGSLWSEAEARALIGMDGNARRVGDLITVLVVDSTSTSLVAETQTERTSEAAWSVDAMLGVENKILRDNANMGGKIGIGGGTTTELDGTGTTTRTGSLEATLTCHVMEVLPNGNLRIRGTKQIRVNRETQYLTLEGVVRPRDILVDNTVRSDLIAESRIEYTGDGVIADKQGPGWGTRVVDTIWPF